MPGHATTRARRIPRIIVNRPIFASPNKAVIRRVIRRSITPVAKLCYLRAMKRNGPKFQGRMLVRFTIDKTGRVIRAKVTRSLGDTVMDLCVVTAFRKTRFPIPRGGLLIVNYPFRFQPSP